MSGRGDGTIIAPAPRPRSGLGLNELLDGRSVHIFHLPRITAALLNERNGAEHNDETSQLTPDLYEVREGAACVTGMQQREVWSVCAGGGPQDQLTQGLKLLVACGWAQEHAAILQLLRLPELHGDEEWL